MKKHPPQTVGNGSLFPPRAQNPFRGFLPETQIFLRDLGAHNAKPWFEAHRRAYETVLLHPFEDLVAALSGTILDIDGTLETTPGVGHTLSRIHRDIRFSKDKSPYRTNMWCTFKRREKAWMDAPAFFFELFPEGYRYGMGHYAPSRDTMEALREEMRFRPEAFSQAIAWYDDQNTFTVEGPCYRRPLPDAPYAFSEWYSRKNFFLVSNHPWEERLYDPTLSEEVAAGFSLLAPLYRHLRSLADRLTAKRSA